MQELNSLDILLGEGHWFFSPPLCFTFFVIKVSTTAPSNDSVYYPSWGFVTLGLSLLCLFNWSRWLSSILLLPPTLDKLVKVVMFDEFLNFIRELNALLNVVAVISRVQVIFIWIPSSRGESAIFLASRSHPFISINTCALIAFSRV